MYTFHTTVHARVESSQSGPPITLRGLEIRPLAIASNELVDPLPCTFEQTAEALLALPRMFCEPDGYFVWSGDQGQQRWQVDGHLFDRGEQMLYMQLKGNCPREAFDLLLQTIGWPATPLLFQLMQEAVILDETEFRRWASAPSDAPRF